MNNSRMWLVVHPTVGIPIFLGAVAVGSFAVHVAVLSNTGWVSDFLSGNELGSTVAARDEAVKLAASPSFSSTSSGQEITIILPDGRVARAVIDEPKVTADAGRATVLE